MTTDRRRSTSTRLTLDDVRGGRARAAGRSRCSGFARSGIALARFLADAGARRDGLRRPAGGRAGATRSAQLEGRAGPARSPGPDVDPATAWAGAALVTTSPSINPDYPTTEPRLRAALRALVAARAGGDPRGPGARVRGRPVPAPLPGADDRGHRDEGQDDDVVADRGDPRRGPGPPGRPRRQHRDPARRAAAGADARAPRRHRALASSSCRRCRAGTTVAVYTNVTSDHLDRHGSLEAYRRGEAPARRARRPGRRARPQRRRPGRRRRTPDLGDARAVVRTGSGRPRAGGVGVVDGWIVAAASSGCRSAGGEAAATGAAADHAGRRAGDPRPAQRLERPGRGRGRPPVRRRAGRDPAGRRRRSRGVEHRLETVAVVDGVRFVNDSQGTQPDAVIAALRAFDPPIVLIAGGRDKGVDLSALAPVVAERAAAAVLIGESGPDLERLFRAAGLARTERAATLEEAVRSAPTRSPASARRRAGDGRARRRCSSARPPPASTCSWTTPPAAARSRRPSPRSPPSDARGGPDERRPAAAARSPRPVGRPIDARRRPRAAGATRRGRTPPARRRPPSTASATRPTTRSSSIVVALTAIGILMVYSSLGDEGLHRDRRHARDRRAADRLGGARARRDGRR